MSVALSSELSPGCIPLPVYCELTKNHIVSGAVLQYVGHTFTKKFVVVFLTFKFNWCSAFYLATLGGWDLGMGVF